MTPTEAQRPPALQKEHEELLEQLEFARTRAGDVGEQAQTLHAAVKLHMDHEEGVFSILMAAEDLAQRHWPATAPDLIERAQGLDRDLKTLHREHDLIATIVRRLRTMAERAGEEEVVRFCDALSAHAEIEEQVLYPSAVIIGRYLRERERESEAERAAAD